MSFARPTMVHEKDESSGESNPPLPPIKWFDDALASRFRNAGIVSSLFGFVFFVPTVVFVQSSVWHPVETVINFFYLFFSPQFWLSASSILFLGFVITKFYVANCFNPFYETNLNIKKYEVLTATAAIWCTFGVVWFFALYASKTPVYLSWTTSTYFVVVSFFTSWQTAVGANFRWQCTENRLLQHVLEVLPWIFVVSARDLPRNVVRGLIIVVPFSLLHSTIRPSFFDLIFAPWTMLSITALIFIVQAYTRLVFEVINVTTMQPIHLPLIGSFGVTAKQQRQQKSMISAITSDNDLLRLFGFRALHDAAQQSSNSRAPIYALSQPGQKPRNWMSVNEVCCRVIEMVREQLQVGSSLMETDLGQRRTTPARRPILASPINSAPGIGLRHQKVEKFEFYSRFFKPAPTVSSYLLTLTEFSLQTLSLLAIHSIDEDQYGVVQENIGDIFGLFIRLELAIDLYIRSTSNKKTEQTFRPNLHRMEDVLVNSLLGVYATFRDYVDALQMSDAERKMLKVLVSVDTIPANS